MRLRRNSKNITPLKRILIVCEGECEVIYLSGFVSDNIEKLRAVRIEIFQPHDHSPVGLVKEAKRQVKEAKRDRFPFDEAWVVFDKDGHKKIPNAFEEARHLNIKIAFSAISFEYWILLHFSKEKKVFYKGETLVKYICKNYFPNYVKTENNYVNLKSKLETALNNARWLHDQNSIDLNIGKRIYQLDVYTDFDKLIIALQKIITDR